MLYKKIPSCRICGNTNLVTVVDLGVMALTGVFPTQAENVEAGPLELMKCHGPNACGLLQLKHNYDLGKLYGDNYGYRSGLNKSMVEHLNGIVDQVLDTIDLKEGDLVLDIGSNDGTTLKAYQEKCPFNLLLVGVDPTIGKFAKYYANGIDHHADFFSADLVRHLYPKKKAKVVTSIAMFYDLESPIKFMQEVYDILDEEGTWLLEQSYMPQMMVNNAYDTICHEHLEYYSFAQLQWMAKKVGFKAIDVHENKANGASFRVVFAKKKSHFKASPNVKIFIKNEAKYKLNDLAVYKDFDRRIKEHKQQILDFLKAIKAEGKKIFGYGASTKGSVILQYCGINKTDLPFIAEVNEYKFGRYAPGTNIPIISEREAREMRPDYFFVFPWHFKDNIVAKEASFLKSAGHLYFPLPVPEII